MKVSGTGAGFGRRSALIVMMMSLAAAGCGGGGGGGKTANNTADAGGQTASPSTPVNPFTPPSENPSATPTPTPTPTGATPPATPVTPPAQAPVNNADGVTLAWEVPTQTSEGAPLGTLAGYHIHYGTDKKVLSETIIVDNPGVVSYVVDTLPKGRYYFAVRAVTTDGNKSALSNVISKEIG